MVSRIASGIICRAIVLLPPLLFLIFVFFYRFHFLLSYCSSCLSEKCKKEKGKLFFHCYLSEAFFNKEILRLHLFLRCCNSFRLPNLNKVILPHIPQVVGKVWPMSLLTASALQPEQITIIFSIIL